MIPAGKSLRVAAYCRVSTDRDDQANSFESQQRYFREYIARQPGWELAGIFADEGLSGTSTKKRLAFQRMIACARARMLDLIVTKEISRFARNTLDSIYYTRELKRLGIGVLFLSDNLYTLDGDAELRLTILASIAQEESRRTSERVKWGQKRRMEQGVVFGRDLLGYDVRGGVLIVNEPGAQIVRDIFRKFVNDGKGAHTIARELNEAGVPAARGGPWRSSVILRILRNEKYKGDALLREYARTLIEYIEYYLRFDGVQGDMVSPIIDEKLDQLGDVYYLAVYAGRKEVIGEINAYYRSLGVEEENLVDVGDKPHQVDTTLIPRKDTAQ